MDSLCVKKRARDAERKGGKGEGEGRGVNLRCQ